MNVTLCILFSNTDSKVFYSKLFASYYLCSISYLCLLRKHYVQLSNNYRYVINNFNYFFCKISLSLDLLPGLGGAKNSSSNCASYSFKLGVGGGLKGGAGGLSGLAPGLYGGSGRNGFTTGGKYGFV